MAVGSNTQRVMTLAIALFLGALAAGTAGLYTSAKPAVYAAQTVLFIDAPSQIAQDSGPAIVDKLSRLRFKYAALINTLAIMQPVSEQLGISPGQAISSVFPVVPGNNLTMGIVASSRDAHLPARLAQATAEQVIAFVKTENRSYRIPVKDQFAFRIIASQPYAVKIAPTQRRIYTVAGLAAALVFSVVLGGAEFLRART